MCEKYDFDAAWDVSVDGDPKIGGDCRPFHVRFDSPASLYGAAEQIFTLSGELDLATAPQLAQALGFVTGTIAIDCRSLTFMDAAGIQVLMDALEHLDRIQLTNVRPRVRRVLTIVGVAEMFLEDP
jgi:anti-anti-sigma factor